MSQENTIRFIVVVAAVGCLVLEPGLVNAQETPDTQQPDITMENPGGENIDTPSATNAPTTTLQDLNNPHIPELSFIPYDKLTERDRNMARFYNESKIGQPPSQEILDLALGGPTPDRYFGGVSYTFQSPRSFFPRGQSRDNLMVLDGDGNVALLRFQTSWIDRYRRSDGSSFPAQIPYENYSTQKWYQPDQTSFPFPNGFWGQQAVEDISYSEGYVVLRVPVQGQWYVEEIASFRPMDSRRDFQLRVNHFMF